MLQTIPSVMKASNVPYFCERQELPHSLTMPEITVILFDGVHHIDDMSSNDETPSLTKHYKSVNILLQHPLLPRHGCPHIQMIPCLRALLHIQFL